MFRCDGHNTRDSNQTVDAGFCVPAPGLTLSKSAPIHTVSTDRESLKQQLPAIIPLMRRESAIDRAKQKDRVERARRMTPEQRLQACVEISSVVLEIARTGKRDREEKRRRLRS